jgi:excisionase family DNA binding protein
MHAGPDEGATGLPRLLPFRLQGMSASTSTPARWLTSREVCDRLGIHLNTLARYVSAGEFGKVLFLSRKDRRISETALDAFIARRLVG